MKKSTFYLIIFVALIQLFFIIDKTLYTHIEQYLINQEPKLLNTISDYISIFYISMIITTSLIVFSEKTQKITLKKINHLFFTYIIQPLTLVVIFAPSFVHITQLQSIIKKPHYFQTYKNAKYIITTNNKKETINCSSFKTLKECLIKHNIKSE